MAYEGTAYCGFQRQARGFPSVQERLEEALARLLGSSFSLQAAGRTDAGVHALQQVVHVRCREQPRLPVERLPQALNGLLPPDIVVTAAAEVPEGFHARHHALAKRYRYVLWTAPYPSPFWRRYAWHVPGPLDVAAMRVAARQLVGQRDFAAFQGSGRRARSTVRRLYRLDVLPAGARLSIVAEADGFLHKMVRNLVGTLVDVGRGRFSPADVAAILASGDRRRAGPTAPGHGLCLERVWYAPDSGAPAFLTAGCPKP